MAHPYTIVAEFINGFLRTEALAAAFELGVIDTLLTASVASTEELARILESDRLHLQILLDMLAHDGVLVKQPQLSLTESFRNALNYRDLLMVRMEFGRTARRLLFDNYALSIKDPYRYQGRLHAFKFYTSPEYTPQERAQTEEWVRFVSTYTRYSAPPLIARHDFSGYRRIMDVGGNNGELAIHICRANPNIHVTIFDIPVVCDIGTDKVAAAGLSDRIAFVKGDARVDEFPGDFDAVVFSTFLHDFEPPSVERYVANAYRSLKSGGEVIIWETYRFDFEHAGFPESAMDLFPFAATLGEPDRYVELLRSVGFRELQAGTDDEIRFLYNTAKR
ncbi:MAG TPA: methyltransferase [Terriglobales bacterium]|nr:methyltransferase [Terriglobales bacterium]